MTQRERILAASVGALLGTFVLWYGYDAYQSRIVAQQTKLDTLRRNIAARELVVHRGQIASKQLVRFEQQSLPSDLERARSLYQNWLLELVARHKVDKSNVTAISGSSGSKGVYQKFTFSVKGRASLATVTRLLHDFYATDRLHRIARINLKPLEDATDLDVDLRIEVLSLNAAPNVKELKHVPSQRLAHGDAAAYAKAIVERNFFGPPHQPPKVASTARSSYTIGSSVSFSIRGDDPEKRPVSYEVEKATFEGGTLDEKTGAFTWKPESKGSYELTVRVTDSGVPPKSATHTVKFAVVDPPPESPPERVVEKPKFDTAKYTYLTAVLDVEGRPEAWLVIRTTGETLRLQPGEQFDVGTLKGTIREITEQDVEIETNEGQRLLISIGESLRDGFPLPVGDI